MSSARAIQRSARQSPYKMRLVIDQIRGLNVNEALALLSFSKKHAAVQIKKVLVSAVANAEQAARRDNAGLDVDTRGVFRPGAPHALFSGLYDLESDIGERRYVSATSPAAVKELRAAWKQWSDQMARPACPPRFREVTVDGVNLNWEL